ncbi:MAG TPA: hypothetical protein VFF73_25495 [Planctomycetota bacterium]|nr:hypothetical protein [Planctomycetota bacterium]
MAMFKLRRFASPEALAHIREEQLRALLSPHAAYFSKRGVRLDGALDLDALVGIFMSPDDDTPEELVNGLYLVHEMSTQRSMEILLTHVPADILGGLEEPTPADVAIQVWLTAPQLLERVHAERFMGIRKRFEYFPVRGPKRELLRTLDRTAALESDLSVWFSEKEKGELVRVFAYPREDAIWFLVRHGEAFRREKAIRNGRSETVFYRPEKHDLVVYTPELGELRVNAETKGEKELYRAKFGEHLFGDVSYFLGVSHRYTLDPLRSDTSLACGDVPGIDWVHLVEITISHGGEQDEVEVRRARDVYKVFGGKLDRGKLISARFRVKFADSAKPRSVTVRLPNVAMFTRDDDGRRVEEWLKRRGFIRTSAGGLREEHGTNLVCA